jgi:uncharacterized membrane protein
MALQSRSSQSKCVIGSAEQAGVRLLANSEGLLLLAGVTLIVAYALWLGIKVVFSPEESQALVGMTTLTVVAGRAAGIAFGYSAKLPNITIFAICAVAETACVLIFYPLFVFSWQHLLVIKSLQKSFEHIHQTAETHKATIRRYGAVGLFGFVLLPLWMTGPAVGSVIGFLLGMPVWLNIMAVLSATYVAIFLWALFLRHVHEQVSSYDPNAAVVLMIAVVVLVLAGHVLHRTHREDKPKA